MKNPFLLFLFLFSTRQAPAQIPPFQLQPYQYRQSVENHAYVYADPTSDLQLSAIKEHWQNGQFVPFNALQRPGKFERGGYQFWVRFELENRTNDTLYSICQGALKAAWADDKPLQIAVYPTKDPYQILTVGQRDVFFLKTLPGTKQALLCKIKAYDLPADFAPKISDLHTFQANQSRANNASILLYGIGFGCLLLIFSYAIMQHRQAKDKAWLWYALYCASLLFIGWRNLERQEPLFFSTHYLLWWSQSKVFHTVAMFVAYTQFVRYFVGIPERHIRLDNALNVFLKICFAASVLELVLLNFHPHWSYSFYWFFRLGCALFLLVLQGWLWQLRDPLSKFVIAGSLSLLFWELVSTALPPNINSQVAIIGIIMDILFLTAGLAYRQKMFRQEHEHLQTDFIAQLQENQRLEREKEQNLSHERDRIAAEMHDDLGAGLSTIRFLSLLAKQKEADPEKAGRIDKIANSASEVMEKMADIIWVMNSRNDALENFAHYLRRYAGDYLDTHGLRLFFEMPDPLPSLHLSSSQRRTLMLAVKECLHNVVKHAGATEVHLKIKTNGKLEITVHDNGKGIPTDLLVRLNEGDNSLTGNGLYNITLRIKDLGGAVFFENGVGTSVHLRTGLAAGHSA